MVDDLIVDDVREGFVWAVVSKDPVESVQKYRKVMELVGYLFQLQAVQSTNHGTLSRGWLII